MFVELKPRELYRSSTLCIRDVACRAHGTDRGAEESSPTTDLVFPRGGVFVKHVAGRAVVADAGVVLFFNRDEAYSVSHPVGCGDDCTALTFAGDTLRDALRTYHPAAGETDRVAFPLTHAPTGPSSFLGLSRLRRAVMEADIDPFACDEAAMRLLGSVVEQALGIRPSPRAAVRPSTRRTHVETVRETQLLLADRFREPLLLADIARAVHCSPFHLVRLFRSIVGRPIHRQLTELRLRAALERIADGPEDLTMLAMDVGFSSHSHFTAAFRRAFGCAPSECRARPDAAAFPKRARN